ncbi:uncharacterized protein LOC135369476 [Ornithodoros turicata]|uniref:uncharacterized protein LOC135369476 n=1 Tax=Ornithodoros turicata TaxID=34597 RepID=UPI00313989DC
MAEGYGQEGIRGAFVGIQPIQPVGQQCFQPANPQFVPAQQYAPQPYQQPIQPSLHQFLQQSIQLPLQQHLQQPLQQIGPALNGAVMNVQCPIPETAQAPLQQYAQQSFPQPDSQCPQQFVQTIQQPPPVNQPISRRSNQMVEASRRASLPAAARVAAPSDPTVNAMYARFLGGPITKPMFARLVPLDDAPEEVVQPPARRASSPVQGTVVVPPTPQPAVQLQSGGGQNAVGLSLENEILLKDRQKRKRKKARKRKIILETSSSDSEPGQEQQQQQQPSTVPLQPTSAPGEGAT